MKVLGAACCAVPLRRERAGPGRLLSLVRLLQPGVPGPGGSSMSRFGVLSVPALDRSTVYMWG